MSTIWAYCTKTFEDELHGITFEAGNEYAVTVDPQTLQRAKEAGLTRWQITSCGDDMGNKLSRVFHRIPENSTVELRRFAVEVHKLPPNKMRVHLLTSNPLDLRACNLYMVEGEDRWTYDPENPGVFVECYWILNPGEYISRGELLHHLHAA